MTIGDHIDTGSDKDVKDDVYGNLPPINMSKDTDLRTIFSIHDTLLCDYSFRFDRKDKGQKRYKSTKSIKSKENGKDE